MPPSPAAAKPDVIFTDPQVAGVGLTERSRERQGLTVTGHPSCSCHAAIECLG